MQRKGSAFCGAATSLGLIRSVPDFRMISGGFGFEVISSLVGQFLPSFTKGSSH
jgi:hypothetical protein